MWQQTKNNKSKKPKKKIITSTFKHKHKKQYGTSQLEIDFAKNFLEKNGINFIYQYEVKEIGRFFDFAILPRNCKDFILEEKDGLNSVKQNNGVVPIDFFIEVDGDYW